MKKYLMEWLNAVASQNITLNVRHDVFETYDDSTGQRTCYLEHFGYGNPDPALYPELFKVKRILTFKNESDKGKEGAVLIVIDVTKADNITINSKSASFNGVTIDLHKEVEL